MKKKLDIFYTYKIKSYPTFLIYKHSHTSNSQKLYHITKYVQREKVTDVPIDLNHLSFSKTNSSIC